MSGVLLIFSACFIWALDTLIRYPLMGSGVSAGVIVGLEHLFLVLCFVPFYVKHLRRVGDLKLSTVGAFVLVGGLGSALSTLAFTRALGMINPSVVMLLQKLQPVFAITLARFVLKESIKPHFLIWAAVAMFGAAMVGHAEILGAWDFFTTDGRRFGHAGTKGMVLTLIAAAGWGASTVFGKVLSNRGISEWGLIGGRYLAGGLLLAPMLLTMGPEVAALPPVGYGKIAIMAVLSGLLALYFYYQGLKKMSARLATLAEMFFPFSAVVVNWVFLGAGLDLWQLIGGVLLIAASGVIQWKKY